MHLALSSTSRTTRAVAAAVTAAAVAGGAAAWVATPASAGGIPVTYTGPTFPSGAGFVESSPTADKPQSKVWRADGIWWAVMASASTGVPTIHKLKSDHTWEDTGTAVDDRANSTADALFSANVLHIGSRLPGGQVRYYRYAYDATADTYTRVTGFPKVLGTVNGAESVAIAKDSTGKIWATFRTGTAILVTRSTNADATSWTTPAAVPVADSAVSNDDVSGIVAFNSSIGIFWSDEQSNAFRFAVHKDGAADGTWTMETPYSGATSVDDHVSVKTYGGEVFAAVKTKNDTSGAVDTAPLVVVLKRSTTGTWTRVTGATVADKGTRPQVVVDATWKRLYLFMTAPTPGGTIYYKTSPLTTLSFGGGRGAVLMARSGAVINNVSTTKDPVTSATNIVAIASDDTNVDTAARRYYHAELSLASGTDLQPPTAPASVSGTPMSATSVKLTWPAGTDDVKVTGYYVWRNGVYRGSSTTTSFTDTTAAAHTLYTYTIKAKDAANNQSSARSTQVTTPPTGGSVFFRSASKATTAGAASLTVAKPAGLANSDVVLATVTTRGTPAVTVPAGWTMVNQTTASPTMRQSVYWRRATASEPASYTFSFASSQAATIQLDAYRGAVPSGSPVRSAAGRVNASSATVTAPATSAVAGDLVVAMFGTARSSGLAPSGLTERSEGVAATVSADVADKQVATTATVGAFTATAATGAAVNIGTTVVLRWN